MFWLKKVISFWLMPLPFCFALLFIGVWLVWSHRRPRFGRALLILSACVLIFFSNRAVSVWLAGSLEHVYPAIPEITAEAPPSPELAACRYIIVLGGGHADSSTLPALSQLSDSGLGRITEGVRLARALPHTTLIVSGPPNFEGMPAHATILARSALSLGIPPERIRKIDYARDTEDEAAAMAAIAGHDRVIVITSAWHMPRAAALFRQKGVDFIPAPTDYHAKPDQEFSLGDYGWDSESLSRSTLAVHEFLGQIWTWWRGKTTRA